MAIERFRIDLDGNTAAADQRLHAGHRVSDRSVDQPPQHERRARQRCLVDQALERRLRHRGSDLARAVERDLDTYGARDTTAGQTALALARRIDDGPESATGLAALSRELRATMTETLSAHANTSGGFLVELQTRREQRRQALT